MLFKNNQKIVVMKNKEINIKKDIYDNINKINNSKKNKEVIDALYSQSLTELDQYNKMVNQFYLKYNSFLILTGIILSSQVAIFTFLTNFEDNFSISIYSKIIFILSVIFLLIPLILLIWNIAFRKIYYEINSIETLKLAVCSESDANYFKLNMVSDIVLMITKNSSIFEQAKRKLIRIPFLLILGVLVFVVSIILAIFKV